MREVKLKIRYAEDQHELITKLLNALEEASDNYDAISGQIRIIKGVRPLWEDSEC